MLYIFYSLKSLEKIINECDYFFEHISWIDCGSTTAFFSTQVLCSNKTNAIRPRSLRVLLLEHCTSASRHCFTTAARETNQKQPSSGGLKTVSLKPSNDGK